MESRKRAELHEQEFLRTIHSENAAFSQIVSLFEGSIDELKTESNGVNAKFAALAEEHQSMLVTLKKELQECVEPQLEAVKQQMDKLDHSGAQSFSTLATSLDAVHTKVLALQSSTEFQAKDTCETLDELRESLSRLAVRLDEISQNMSETDKRMNDLKASITSDMENKLCEFESRFDEKTLEFRSESGNSLHATEAGLRSTFESRIEGLKELMDSEFQDRLEQLALSFETRLADRVSDIEKKFAHRESSLEQSVQNRLDELENSIQSKWSTSDLEHLVSSRVNPVLEEVRENQTYRTEIGALDAKLSRLESEFTDQLAMQHTMVKNIAHAGYRYEWKISDAISRFKSLGILSSGGKYVTCEQFNIGPYRNLSLRLFPISTTSQESPTVWLIQRPGSSDAILPLYVDISIGFSKRGPILRKQVSELFGHWVWEAVFDPEVIASEKIGEDLSLSVEISMRQWMDPECISSQKIPIEDQVPESPSAMSNYTFAPPPQTNPFDRGSVTPRRASWAQFASIPDENVEPSRLASNPFQ
jgi:hypothetical protein